jgi:hypothetical protein
VCREKEAFNEESITYTCTSVRNLLILCATKSIPDRLLARRLLYRSREPGSLFLPARVPAAHSRECHSGSSNTPPVILYNMCSGSVTLSQAAVDGSCFSISGLAVPQTLVARESTEFSVTLAPTAAESATGNVAVVINAANSPTHEPLSGNGIHAVKPSWSARSSQAAGYNVYSDNVSASPYTKVDSCLVTHGHRRPCGANLLHTSRRPSTEPAGSRLLPVPHQLSDELHCRLWYQVI